MNLYKISLFLHVLGALILFIALGIEWLTYTRLKKTSTVQYTREWMGNLMILRKAHPIALILILIPGIYMMVDIWKGAAWIIVAFICMVAMAILGNAVTGKRMMQIGKSLQNNAVDMNEVRNKFNQKILLNSIWIRTAIGVAIIFLMTDKPALTGSIITVAVATVAGFIPGFIASGETEKNLQEQE